MSSPCFISLNIVALGVVLVLMEVGKGAVSGGGGGVGVKVLVNLPSPHFPTDLVYHK